MVEGSNPSGPAVKLQRNHPLPTSASKREVLSTQRRDLGLISRHLAKPCLFPFDGEPYRSTECQQASSPNTEAEAGYFPQPDYLLLAKTSPRTVITQEDTFTDVEFNEHPPLNRRNPGVRNAGQGKLAEGT